MQSIVTAMLLAAAAPSGTTAAPTPTPPVPPATTPAASKPATAQAMFDTASAAAEAGRCDEALAGFTALEVRASIRKASKVLAVVQLRKGDCLLQQNQLAAAGIAFQAGLTTLQDDIAAHRSDVLAARMGLGRIAYLSYDYASAREQFEIAKLIAGSADRSEISLWLARATMFDEGPAALTYAEDALAAATAVPGTSKLVRSDLQTLHARALLNHGSKRDAYAELKKAMAAQGGLTLRVNVRDVVTRSDLALAALLTGDTDSAREYLAYSGAGHTGKAPFASAASMTPPPCGGEAELRPEDVAIVEFGIRDDGSVSYANPIYTSRLGPAALVFTRAVADWSWRPDDVKVVGPLFRAVTRVELRCSESFKHPSVEELLRSDLYAWLKVQHAQVVPNNDRAAAAVAGLRQELAKRQAAGETVGLVPVLVALAENPVLPTGERQELLGQVRQIAVAGKAPVAARLYLEADQVDDFHGGGDRSGKRRAHLRELLAQPEMAADARAAAALRLLVAEPFFHAPAPADAATLLKAVVDDTRLTPQDPLRINALVRLASLQAGSGDLVAARNAYLSTGLDAQQCALIDAKPALQHASAGSNRFPLEAVRWGFEGWVKTEYDITADGRTAGSRAVIAYPPFVFRDAAVGIAKDLRFEKSYRPEGAVGCTAAQQNISFHIEGAH